MACLKQVGYKGVLNINDIFANIDTSNVTNMDYMFRESNAKILDLSSFDLSNTTGFSYMFYLAKGTIGYAKTNTEVNKLNSTTYKPTTLTFRVK